MRKSLILAAFAMSVAAPAAAQNDMMPSMARLTGTPAAPVASGLTITSAGTYGEEGELRMIDVSIDKDRDGDGANDEGLLRVTCANGQAVSAIFSPRDSASGQATGKRQHKPMPIKAQTSSTIAAGKTYKATWNIKEEKGARTAPKPTPVRISTGQANICA